MFNKKLEDTLTYLGSEYSVRNFDYEPCIYRKFGNHEIEVSGLTSSGKYNATIYVWENGTRVIKSIQDIHSKEELAKHLETVFAKYPDSLG